MIEAPLLLAFTAGMVASVNPCGFALLPAYVGAFVAGDDLSTRVDRRVARAVWVSFAVASGFAVLFTVLGTALNVASSPLRGRMPWVTIVVGAVMVVLGAAMLAGWKPRLPFGNRALSKRSDAAGMFLFGVSYALVSLSCTIGPFLAVAGFAMNQSALDGVVTYIAYAAGMGSIILALSVGAALAHQSFAEALRSTSRVASRLAGVLLLLSGGYAIWYARHELLVYSGARPSDPLVDLGDRIRIRFLVFVESVGAERIGVAVVLLTAAVYLGLRLWRRSRHNMSVTTAPDEDPSRKEPVNT